MVGASTAIEKAVTAWNGVTAHQHRFGGIEFRLAKRELGISSTALNMIVIPALFQKFGKA